MNGNHHTLDYKHKPMMENGALLKIMESCTIFYLQNSMV